MFIDIIPLQKNTARLTRVYGDAPCAALPASVPGPEGGVLAITELGDYCFSEKPRSLPGADALCRYEVSPDGTCTLVQAFGRNLTGRHGRYDLDFGEQPAAPEELHPGRSRGKDRPVRPCEQHHRGRAGTVLAPG